MSKTIIPSVSDVLRCIGETLENVVAPTLDNNTERSAVTTIRHLLRYVTVRLESEGQVLLDEANLLRNLLAQGVDYLKTGPAANEASTQLAVAIERTLAEKRKPEIYPTLTLMAEEVGALRQHVCDLLASLRSSTPSERGPAGEDLLQSLRRYISWQIEQEAKIVEPAFFGYGARR